MNCGFCAGCKRMAYFPVDIYCGLCEEKYEKENGKSE
jgi:hypothetical protein